MPQDGAEPPLKPYRSILDAEIVQAREELQRPAHGLLISGVLAGLAIGTSLFLMAVLLSGATADLPEPVVRILVANAFTVGFVLVILSRVDLFTEYTTIAILPVLVGRAGLADLMRLWGLVYVGNLVGALTVAAFLTALGPAMGVIDPAVFQELAHSMTRHTWLVTSASGLFAGWLMGVLSWLVAAGRDTTSQLLFVWAITLTIALGGLHHSITGAAEVSAAVFAGQGATVGEFGHFLVWTTLGNALGGLLFAVLVRYSLVVREEGDPERRDASPRRRGSGNGTARRGGDGEARRSEGA